MCRSTYSRAAAWLARVSPSSRVDPGRWNQLGWCRAETLRKRNSRRSCGSRATAFSAQATWASKEVGEGTPNSGSQCDSANRPGNTDPSGPCLLKKPTPPTHTEWYPAPASPETRSGVSYTKVREAVVSLPANRAANNRG